MHRTLRMRRNLLVPILPFLHRKDGTQRRGHSRGRAAPFLLARSTAGTRESVLQRHQREQKSRRKDISGRG
ncbi:hypothetical protein C8R44DRAFT_224133 [Mycena epipterygia]|nr:hypothetical protein C8R44DRAFT_224133 [Mycena epipterygia]